jgi:hypothetical protein
LRALSSTGDSVLALVLVVSAVAARRVGVARFAVEGFLAGFFAAGFARGFFAGFFADAFVRDAFAGFFVDDAFDFVRAMARR